jgi:hypothetical protein
MREANAALASADRTMQGLMGVAGLMGGPGASTDCGDATQPRA